MFYSLMIVYQGVDISFILDCWCFTTSQVSSFFFLCRFPSIFFSMFSFRTLIRLLLDLLSLPISLNLAFVYVCLYWVLENFFKSVFWFLSNFIFSKMSYSFIQQKHKNKVYGLIKFTQVYVCVITTHVKEYIFIPPKIPSCLFYSVEPLLSSSELLSWLLSLWIIFRCSWTSYKWNPIVHVHACVLVSFCSWDIFEIHPGGW